ncbi:MAG TPA: hydrogenase maturation nickel metallochaperone HypA [Bacteroidales bacterium]|jgi:hydrogenase nickel incorporation protein HypA/HybF|nr:hydrogenase maturation nickel metallochaperone HypA [Bacteroidales bacterium]
MHELRIAEDLSRIVIETAVKGNLSRVTKVNVTFGEMVQIVPEIFEFAFREAVRDSVASDALLGIEMIRVALKCRECGNEFSLNETLFSCGRCGSYDIEIVNGKELYVKSIEGE